MESDNFVLLFSSNKVFLFCGDTKERQFKS